MRRIIMERKITFLFLVTTLALGCHCHNFYDIGHRYEERLASCDEVGEVFCNRDCKSIQLCLADGASVSLIDCEDDGATKCDSITMTCKPPEDALCITTPSEDEFVCRGTGFFPSPYNCSKYFDCGTNAAEHNGILQTCPEGTAYDPLATSCRLTTSARVCTEGPIPKCENALQSGAQFENPNIYYVCINDPVTHSLVPLLFKCKLLTDIFVNGHCQAPDATTASTSVTPTTATSGSETPTTATDESETPTTATSGSETPTTATDESETPTAATDESETPTTVTDGSETPTTATDESETPTTATDGSETPSTATDESETPSTATDESETPTTATDESETPTTATHESETPTTATDESETPTTATDESETPTTSTPIDTTTVSTPSSETTPTTTISPPTTTPYYCISPGTNVPDPLDCHSYYLCTLNMEQQHFRCQNGFYFNKEKGYCVKGTC